LLIIRLKQAHPVYELQLNTMEHNPFAGVSGANYLPDDLIRELPKLILRLERAKSHELNKFLQDDVDAARIINTMVACETAANLVGKPVEDLRRIAEDYKIVNLGTDYSARGTIKANEQESPFAHLRKMLDAPSTKDMKEKMRTELEKMGAKFVVFQDNVPASFAIDAANLTKNGREIFERFPTVDMLIVTDIKDGTQMGKLMQMEELQFLNLLNLSNNKIGDVGAEIVAKSANLGQLRQLVVMNCQISAKGLREIAGVLDSNLQGLQTLSLQRNNGLESLATQVKRDLESRGRKRAISF